MAIVVRSIDTLTSILNDSVLYQNSPRNSAQIDAATAPSVGVKIPVVMPPISSTGVMDRKSTRLNSSHGYISYAVFCLKKKKNKKKNLPTKQKKTKNKKTT